MKHYSRREFVKQNSAVAFGAAMPFSLDSAFHEKLTFSSRNPSQIDRIENIFIAIGQTHYVQDEGSNTGQKNRYVFLHASLSDRLAGFIGCH